MAVGTYDSSSIESYEHVAAVRERPTMYIEELGYRGLFRLVNELKDNFIDEWLAGRATIARVDINESTETISIKDDGAGIPIDKAINCAIKLHTGGKFNSDAYDFKGGLNGVGLKAVNALSTKMILEVWRDNKYFRAEFAEGKLLNEKTVPDKSKYTGTKVTFTPDHSILGKFSINGDDFKDYFRKCAYINPGFTIILSCTKKNNKSFEEKYYTKNGIIEYLNNYILDGKKTVLDKPIVIPKIMDDFPSEVSKTGTFMMGIEAVFTWRPNYRGLNILSFVNGIQTANDGFHISGLTKGICNVIREDLKNGNYLSKKDPLNGFINRDDILEGFTGILVALHKKPLFDGQTKNKFSSKDYEAFAEKYASEQFKTWTNLNKSKYKQIIDHIILSAKARYAAYNARNSVKTVSSVSGASVTGIQGYSGCHSKNPEECELFIVEGDSAGGSAKTCRNAKTQAIYCAFGVPANTYAMKSVSNMLKSEVKNTARDLVTILGCGIGNAFDISKLRFHKIIIMADADADGGHITSLHLGFFYRFYRELVERGYIYVANPPLFQIKNKGKSLYVSNLDEYYKRCDYTIFTEFELCAYKGKKVKPVSNEFYKVYLSVMRGYYELLDGIGKHKKMDPLLLERVILNYNHILKHDDFRIDGWYFIKHTKDNKPTIEGIYNDIFHRITLDDAFFNDVSPIISHLKKIKWQNLVLRHRKTKKYMKVGPFNTAQSIHELLNRGIEMKRFKGLGEMNPAQLWDTTMNPKTRSLTQVVLDAELSHETDKMLDILIGNDLQGRKEYYRNVLGADNVYN